MVKDNRINVNGPNISSGIQNTASLKTSANSDSPSFGTVDVKANSAKQELLKRLGITEEQLTQILAKRADFYSLSPEEQVKIVAGFNTGVIESEKKALDTDKKQITVNNTKDTTPAKANAEEELPKEVNFDNKAFAAASLPEKGNIYAEEFAKNKFMYADSENPKTQEEWDALPKDKKQELVKAALNKDVKKNGKEVFDKKDADMLLQYNMTKIQAANAKNISADAMDAKGLAYTEEAVHDYIVNLDENERTDGQTKYVEEQANKSKLLVEYSKKQGHEADWGDGTYILSPREIKQHCNELGVTIQEIQKQHLEEKKQKLGLSKDEEEKLSNLTKLDGLIQAVKDKTKNGPVDFGRMKEFEASEYGKLFKTAQGTDEKMAIATKYLKEKNGGIDFSAEFISELVQNDPELAAELQGEFIANSNAVDKKKIAANTTGLNQELNAYNIDKHDAESSKIVAETQKNMVKADANRAAVLANLTMDRADGEHLIATSPIYSSFGLDSVEKKHAEVAYDKARVNKEQQLEMLSNTYQNSGVEARKYAGVNNNQAYEENQLPLHNKAIQDKEVNDAMVEAGTYSKYSAKNQTAAFNAHKQRYEQDDYSAKEAIAGLNKLSDNIYKCDKDNQLAMHNEIMNTKYSEVQEHAAANIKNYEGDVQTKALSTVYKSGNEKAIAIAVNEVIPAIKSTDAQQLALKQAVMELSGIVDTTELQAKFANGSLSKSEIAKLSSAERRDYYERLFNNATPAEKIQYLRSIPNGRNKNTIYSLIGKYYPNLFEDLIKTDATLAETVYNMAGLDKKAKDTALKVIMNMTTSDFVSLRNKLHLNDNKDLASVETNPVTAKTVNMATPPMGFDTKEIYPKDRKGIYYV